MLALVIVQEVMFYWVIIVRWVKGHLFETNPNQEDITDMVSHNLVDHDPVYAPGRQHLSEDYDFMLG